MISNNNVYKLPINIAWQIERSEGFVYIYNLKKKQFYYFDNISKDIWMQIKDNKSVGDIKNSIAEKYQVGYEIIEADINEFIEDLEEKELIIEMGV